MLSLNRDDLEQYFSNLLGVPCPKRQKDQENSGNNTQAASLELSEDITDYTSFGPYPRPPQLYALRPLKPVEKRQFPYRSPTHISPYIEEPSIIQTRENLGHIITAYPNLPPTSAPEEWHLVKARPPRFKVSSQPSFHIDLQPWQRDRHRFPLYTEVNALPVIRIPIYAPLLSQNTIAYLLDTPSQFTLGCTIYEPYHNGVGIIQEITGYIKDYVQVRIVWKSPKAPFVAHKLDGTSVLTIPQCQTTFLIHSTKIPLSRMEGWRSWCCYQASKFLGPEWEVKMDYSTPTLASAVLVTLHMNIALHWWILYSSNQHPERRIYPYDLELRMDRIEDLVRSIGLTQVDWYKGYLDYAVE